jgi:H+/Cl- antiporter ClcA
MLAIYVSAVVVAILLRRQERRHRKELALVCEHLALPPPSQKPKLRLLECWLNILLGLFLTAGGTYFFWLFLSISNSVREGPRIAVPLGEWEFSAILLATGISLLFLGFRSIQELHRYNQT